MRGLSKRLGYFSVVAFNILDISSTRALLSWNIAPYTQFFCFRQPQERKRSTSSGLYFRSRQGSTS